MEEIQVSKTPRQKILSLIARLDGYTARLKERKKHIEMFSLPTEVYRKSSRAEVLKRELEEIKKEIMVLRFIEGALIIVLRKFEEGEFATAIKVLDLLKQEVKPLVPEIVFDLDFAKKEMLRANEDEAVLSLEQYLVSVEESD